MLKIVKLKGNYHVRDNDKNVFVRVNRKNVVQALTDSRKLPKEVYGVSKRELLESYA